MCVRDPAARFRPGDANSLSSPSNQWAQGMPGARCTRGLVCQRLRIWRTRAYRAAETLRHPLRNGFTAYFVLSPVERACCHRHLQIAPQLSASIAAPGPHDFAVRFDVFVRRKKMRLTPKRPSQPRPTHRDDRETPPRVGRVGETNASDLPDMTSGIFFHEGFDTFLKIRSDLPVVSNLSHARVAAGSAD